MGKIWNYHLGFSKYTQPQKHTKHVIKKPILHNYPVDRTKHFHRKKHIIKNTIMSTIGEKEIIYGEMGLKARFPRYLERHTTDVDVYSPTPYRDALQAERKLDRAFGGDYFYTKEAIHHGTFKVSSHANDEGYADFTRTPRNTPYNIIRGKKYVTLAIEKQHRLRSLRDPKYKWRWGKDRDALNRLKIYEKYHRR